MSTLTDNYTDQLQEALHDIGRRSLIKGLVLAVKHYGSGLTSEAKKAVILQILKTEYEPVQVSLLQSYLDESPDL